MRKHFFWLRYPEPTTVDVPAEFQNEPKEDRIELALEFEPLPTAPLEHYLRERGLVGPGAKLRKRLHMERMSDHVPVHYWYVPQSGDVIRCTARAAMRIGEDE